MPDQPSPGKVVVTARVWRETAKRLDKLVALRGESKGDVIRSIYEKATDHIELTPEEIHQIAEETRKARELQNRKNAKSATRKARRIPGRQP